MKNVPTINNMEDNMKTYYCVTNSYDNRGRVVANITNSVEAEEKPQDTFTETRRADIYNNWFDSYREAQDFVRQCKMA